MLSTTQSPIFFIPLEDLSSAHLAGNFDIGCGFRSSQRFVGDQANFSLKYLCEPTQLLPSDWPLVLFGPSGTGKTAIGRSVASKLADTSSKKMAVFSADDFRRRFASSIDTDSTSIFRSNICKSSVLFIDNLHELSKYEAAQNELTTIIDSLSKLQIPVIFTINDQSLLSGCLIHRLSSRLNRGLCLSVNAPGKTARRILVSESAQSFDLVLADNALEYLADKLAVTCPMINSFFAQFTNWLKSCDQHLGSKIDQSLIVDFLASRKKSSGRTIDLIIARVADIYDLKVSEIKSNSRKQSTVLARGIAVYLLRNLLGISFSKIGDIFSGRDHSTVMHAVNRIDSMIRNNNNELMLVINSVKQSIHENNILELESLREQPVD